MSRRRMLLGLIGANIMGSLSPACSPKRSRRPASTASII